MRLEFCVRVIARELAVKMLAAAVATFLAVGPDAALADQNSGLPILSACQPATHPQLPPRWHAVGLMLPFVRQQLAVGDFVYDKSARAMRATLYGLQSGSIDLLITDGQTYQLTGNSDSPTQCTALGHKYDLPGESWLPKAAVCDGEAPVGAKSTQWWKASSSDGRAIWQWYRTDTRLPWRIMLPDRSPEPAVIGDYAMTYFPKFEPLAQTNLARLRDFCAANAKAPAPAAAAAKTAPELMASPDDLSEAERARRIQALIPGLSLAACPRMTTPHWPDQFVMTAILTPIQFRYTPLPTMLYYNWSKAHMLIGLMHEARTRPPALELESVLTNGIGYGIERTPNGAFACRAATPGVVRPDWMSVAGCGCNAVIDHNPDLGANEVSVIRGCPVKGEGDHVNWSWYTSDGRPILFTEPEAIGLGLNIADYLRWFPGAAMPAESFSLPAMCTAQAAEAGMPAVHSGPLPDFSTNCSACHTTRH